MGPRPRGRGILRWQRARVAPCVLQWGRDRAVAELIDLIVVNVLFCHASMGPRPRGRGIDSARSKRWPRHPGFNGAATARSRNCSASHQTGPAYPRFNGAATARSRNCADDLLRAVRLHHFNGAATARSRNCAKYYNPRWTDSTSMGPRPRGRGIGERHHGRLVDNLLQWGRDRAVAELICAAVGVGCAT